MKRKKIRYKVGDEIEFIFAGSREAGKIVKIGGSDNDPRYYAHDGSYTYPVSIDMIV